MAGIPYLMPRFQVIAAWAAATPKTAGHPLPAATADLPGIERLDRDSGPADIRVLAGIVTSGQNFTSPHAPISRVWMSMLVLLLRRSSLYATATFTPLVIGNATPAFQ